jgi:hypothetical protein
MRYFFALALGVSGLSALVACDGATPIDPDPTGVTSGQGGGASATGQGGASTGQGGNNASSSTGSGGDDGGPAGLVSGTRLRAHGWSFADGAKQQLGFHDTLFGFDCTGALATDDKLRCLPNSASSSYYADSNCTAPAYLHPAQCPTPVPSHVRLYGGSTCNTTASVHAVGTLTSQATVYVKSGTNCLSQAVPAGYDYYNLGAEIPPDQFVEATKFIE